MIRTGTVRVGSSIRKLVGRRRRGVAVLAGLLPLAPAAHAQIKTWNVAPPTNGGWHVDDFWLPVGVPTATDTVQFTNGGMCTNGGNGPALALILRGGSTLDVIGTQAFSGQVRVGDLGGTGNLIVRNTGFNGTVNASSVLLNADGAAASFGRLRIGNGSGPGVVNAPVSGGGPSEVVFNHTSGSHSFGQPLTGSLSVVHDAGTTTLSSPGTNYTGATTINGGTLRITNNTNFASPIQISLLSALDIATDVRLNGGLSGPGPVTVSGNGATARVAGNNSAYTGTFSLPSGTRGMMWSNAAAGSAGAAWDISGQFGLIELPSSATVQLGALSGSNPATQLAAFGGTGLKTIEVGARGADWTFAGQIKDASTFGGGGTSTVALRKVGTGTLALTGTNSYSAGTELLGGSVRVTSNSNLGSGTVTFNGGGIRTTDISEPLTRNFSLAGTGTIEVLAGTLIYDGQLTGSGILNKTGAWNLEFTGIGDIPSAEIRVLNGTMAVASADLEAGAARIADNASTATMSVTDSMLIARNYLNVGDNFDGGPGGTGTLTIGSGGHVQLDSVSNAQLTVGWANATGTVNLNPGGTLQVRGTDGIRKHATGTANFNFAGGKILALGQNLTSSVPMTLSGTTSTIEGSGNAITLSGALTGSGALIKTGANSTLALSSNATNYSGATTVSDGTLQITNNFNFNSPIQVAAAGALSLNIAQDVRLLQGVSGPGPITVTGNTATARLSGNDSGYSGTFSLPSGTRGLMWSNAAAGSAAGAWDLSGQFALIETPNAATMQLGALSGSNAATQLAAFSGSGLKTFEVGALGTNTTFAGQIKNISTFGGGGSNTVALSKVGAGTLILSNANTYTGGTTVSGGTLQVNGSIAGATTVVGGGTLGGTGTVNGSVQIQTGGTLSPGASPGQLTAAGSVTIDGALRVEISGAAPGTGYDQLIVSSGNVTLGAGSSLTFGTLSGTFSASDKLFIVNNTGAGTLSGAFAGLPDGGASGTPVPALNGLGGLSEWRIYYGADQATNALTGGNDIALAPASTTPCTGDVNGDQQVDLSDLTILLAHFGIPSGATLADGDLDGDGDVDLSDLTVLLSAFGTICP